MTLIRWPNVFQIIISKAILLIFFLQENDSIHVIPFNYAFFLDYNMENFMALTFLTLCLPK